MYIDMHAHSVSSDDSRATVEGYLKWIQVLRKKGYSLDAVVLTEHRKFDADADYSALGDGYGVLVMRGSELDTRYGHVLVYGVTDDLTKQIDFSDVRMDTSELIKVAKATGAVCAPAHPGRTGIGLCGFIEQGIVFDNVDIVETHNGGSRRGENERAQELAMTHGLKSIGGSDAHLVSSIGTCVTYFPQQIRDEGELVDALRASQFSPHWLEDTKKGDIRKGGGN